MVLSMFVTAKMLIVEHKHLHDCKSNKKVARVCLALSEIRQKGVKIGKNG